MIPTTVPWPAKFAWQCQSRRAHTCPMTPWRLVTLVDADAKDMTGTNGMLARGREEVNEADRVSAEDLGVHCTRFECKSIDA